MTGFGGRSGGAAGEERPDRFVAYEQAVAPARAGFAHNPALAAVLSPQIAADELERFLIQFSALGVAMTEPVDGWIRRAGERCRAIGLDELGRALELHAKHEAGHHLLMIADTHKLVAGRNARHGTRWSADALLARPHPPGVDQYRALHEQVIAGPTPYGQLAIEYEIEMLSVVHGGPLIERCVARLGPDVVAGLSFLEEHVAVDVGHTKFNAAEISRLTAAHPDFVGPLAAAGTAALAAYGAFLVDCLDAARAMIASG